MSYWETAYPYESKLNLILTNYTVIIFCPSFSSYSCYEIFENNKHFSLIILPLVFLLPSFIQPHCKGFPFPSLLISSLPTLHSLPLFFFILLLFFLNLILICCSCLELQMALMAKSSLRLSKICFL